MTEEEMIALIGAGGRAMDAGVKALYQTSAQPMLRYFVHQGLSGDDAKDVLQETFVKVVRSAGSFGGSGSARSWIWQIARNCFLDHVRKRLSVGQYEVAVNDEQWGLILETTKAPDQDSGMAQSVDDCVFAGLSKLGEREPERVYVLTLQMEGVAIAEIAQRIGRQVPGTKEYLSQCKKKLKPLIEHCMQLVRN